MLLLPQVQVCSFKTSCCSPVEQLPGIVVVMLMMVVLQ